MTSLEKPEVVTTNVRYRMPSIHREGYKYIAIAAALSLFFMAVISDEVGWLLVIVTLWVISFFRDPVRTTPRGDRLIVSPADGLVTMIADVPVPRELAGDDALGSGIVKRVSIFMSVFDVHINRTPIGGTIKRVVYISGKFLNADLDKASEENERQHILVESREGLRVGFTQIAGLVARRILPFVKPGDIVATGQRVGLILTAASFAVIALGMTIAGSWNLIIAALNYRSPEPVAAPRRRRSAGRGPVKVSPRAPNRSLSAAA